MKCPICNVDLVMAERQGVEIDYCPKCRGIWLDRGELDKIIEKAQVQEARSAQAMPQNFQQPVPGYQQQPQQGYRNDGYRDEHYYKKHKKGGLLGEIFDF